jgi:hypothetical protein
MIESKGAHAPDYQKTRHPHWGRCKDSVCYQNDNECNPMKLKQKRFLDNKSYQNDFICQQNDNKRNHYIRKSGHDVSCQYRASFALCEKGEKQSHVFVKRTLMDFDD